MTKSGALTIRLCSLPSYQHRGPRDVIMAYPLLRENGTAQRRTLGSPRKRTLTSCTAALKSSGSRLLPSEDSAPRETVLYLTERTKSIHYYHRPLRQGPWSRTIRVQ